MGDKILVIDDNADNRLLFTDILEAKGYTVIAAADGRAGLELAKKELPGLVVLDIQMPVLDGFETCKLLRGDPATADLVILGVTSYALKGDKELVLAAGFNGYVSKPIDTRKFPETVAEMFAARTAGKGAV